MGLFGCQTRILPNTSLRLFLLQRRLGETDNVQGNHFRLIHENGFGVRIVALKNILVVLYGTTGSFWNRLANVDTFEEINRLSREILIKSKDILQGLGYELLYADTDSVFLKKDGAFCFSKDVNPSEAETMAAVQNPFNISIFAEKSGPPAWKHLPTWYQVSENDESIPPDVQCTFAKQMDATTISLPSSHASLVSHPDEIAKLILDAAKAVTTKK